MFKYYVVSDHPDFRDEIHESLQEDHNCGCEFIPDRTVDCHDPMHGSEYNGIFILTPEEAEKLKEDPRIRDVHRIPEEIGVIKRHHGSRAGSFDKGPSVNSDMRNWALSRVINKIENYNGASTTSTPYTFNLDGEGVDVIISDTGVLPNHPEFAVNEDGTGGSRVVDHDWSQYGFLSTPTGGWLGDCEGHGSNVAGIIAGNRNGWASKAAIYSLRCIGTGAATEHDKFDGRVLGILNSVNTWRTIKAFHLAKPITSTGYRRPTLVNASWGSLGSYPTAANTASYGTLVYTVWRGNAFSTSVTTSTYGMINTAAGGDGTYPTRSSAEDAEIASMLAAGVIMTAAAGNNYHKIDVPGGIDYNNRWISIYDFNLGLVPGNYALDYYHQGSTPATVPGVICVGAISTAAPEHKISWSSTGPRVDIFCPGTYIMGPWTGTSFTSIIRDPRNNNYWLDKLSGTSMAAPQVAGVAALIAQARPWMTSTDVLKFLNSVSAKNLLNETYYANPTTSTYTSFGNLQGATNQIMYMPFNQSTVMSISTAS
jgi:subtilisin family serine protease